MAVKRYILTAVFILLLAISYLYIVNKYNIKTVEISFSGKLSKSDIYSLRASAKDLVSSKSDKELICIANYIGAYHGSKVIMTSGLDRLTNEINLKDGRWIANGDIKEAVLGDRFADKIYRSADIVGRSFRLFGQDYRIVGIIKNSNEIYISFDESSRIEWGKKSIKFIIEDDKRLPLYVELLQGKLKSLGLNVTDVNVYKQEAYLYINIILVITMLAFLQAFRKLWKDIYKSARQLCSSYKEQFRTIELHRYMFKNKKDIAVLLLKLIIESILLFTAIKCVRLMQVPPDIIPQNLFSPSSYIEVIKMKLQNYISRMENGISGILLEVHIINILLIIYIGLAAILKKKAPVH